MQFLNFNIIIVFLLFGCDQAARSYLSESENRRSGFKAGADALPENLPQTIELILDHDELPFGLSLEAKAIVKLLDQSEINITALGKWSVSEEDVLQLNGKASEKSQKIKTLKPGKAEIRVEWEGFSASKIVSINELELVELRIKVESTTSPVGGNGVQIIAEGLFNNEAAYNLTESVEWSISEAVKAKILNNDGDKGLLLGFEPSQFEISADYKSTKQILAYTFTPAVLDSIYIDCNFPRKDYKACRVQPQPTCNEPNPPYVVTRSATLNAYAFMSDCKVNSIKNDPNLKFKSSETSIVSIPEGGMPGVIHFIAPGEASVSLSYMNQMQSEDRKVFNVEAETLVALAFPGDAAPSGLSHCALTPVEASLFSQMLDTGYQFQVYGYFNSCKVESATAQATWTSSLQGLGQFSTSTRGLFELSQKNGITNISASFGGFTVSRNNVNLQLKNCLGSASGLVGYKYAYKTTFGETPTNLSWIGSDNKSTFQGLVKVDELNLPLANYNQSFVGYIFIGTINAPKTGNYDFRITSDDGMRVEIDDRLVIEDPGLHSERTREKNNFSLTKGLHNIKVIYFQGPSAMSVKLSWNVPDDSDSYEVINKNYLSYSAEITCLENVGSFP